MYYNYYNYRKEKSNLKEISIKLAVQDKKPEVRKELSIIPNRAERWDVPLKDPILTKTPEELAQELIDNPIDKESLDVCC